MGILGFIFGENEEVEVTITNERNGETWTSIASNDDEVEECLQSFRDAGYTVIGEDRETGYTVIGEEESKPWWKLW